MVRGMIAMCGCKCHLLCLLIQYSLPLMWNHSTVVGFDPLGLKPDDPDEFLKLHTKELQNGRLAMLAWAGFTAQELVNGQEILPNLGLA